MPELGRALRDARTVVTGGAGFLGSHLCDRLIAEGAAVVCIDSLVTGSLRNIQHLQADPGFMFMAADVTVPSYVDGGVDFVLHLASPASPKDYALRPIHTLKVGSLGTFHTLGMARAKGAAYLLASTSEVYGSPQVSPQREEYWGNVNSVGPRSAYDEAKRFAEALASS